jgi:hypothetical protein
MRSHSLVRDVGYALGGLGLLLLVYVGGYFAMVSRRNPFDYQAVTEMIPYTYTVMIPVQQDGKTVMVAEQRQGMRTVSKAVPVHHDRVIATYAFADRFGPELLSSFFAPAHDVDRRIRTEFWKDQFLMNDATPVPPPPVTVPGPPRIVPVPDEAAEPVELPELGPIDGPVPVPAIPISATPAPQVPVPVPVPLPKY